MEAVIARAPDALLLIRGGKISHRNVAKPAGLEQSAGDHNGKVYYVDDGIQEPSPVAIDALEDLAKEFHP